MEIDVENLGGLELATLDFIWSEGPADVGMVHETVGVEREITYNTVQSAMKRLWEKGLLEREKESHAYIYSPAIERRDFARLRLTGLVDDLMQGDLDPALEAFVEVAEDAGEEKLDELESMIAQRRSGREDD